MEPINSFGYWLRRRRKALDLTQDALARQAGCALGTLKKIETDERRPSRQLAERLADCLAVPAAERAVFLKAARAELATDQLAVITQPIKPPDLDRALPSSTARLHILPAQLTTLIGREREIATVSGLLRSDDVRMLTLTGPGGTGKTRLALQCGAELHDTFADGIWFVNLAPIADASLVATTIAHTLGLIEPAGNPIEASLRAFLRAKQLLLLLDNFEQVLDAAPLVADLLAAAPGLKVLVTSRATLHLYGEHEVAVLPLALPPLQDDRRPTTDDRDSAVVDGRWSMVTQYASVRLFIARAQATKADFAITHANAPAVAEICRRLDGLPLAIELAAARIKLFAPEALLARLAQPLTLLVGGPRDLPARQQTLRNTIDWSYKLLDEGEQALFRHLAVFVGGCMLEAAEAVLSTAGRGLSEEFSTSILSPQSAVLEKLASLTDKSLLRQIEGPDGEPRFTMLETVHEYALERLEESGTAELIRQQHANYFVTLAEAAELHRYIATQGMWLVRLDAEHDNMRAALAWSQTAAMSVELAARLAAALQWFWRTRGYMREGRAWIERVLQQSTSAAPPLRAKVLYAAGCLQSDGRRATMLIEQALALWRELGDKPGMADALLRLGRVTRLQGDYERSATLVHESLALFREQQIMWGVVWALLSLGDVALDQGDATQALEPVQEALALTQSLGDTNGNMWARCLRGRLAHLQGDLERAAILLEESLAWVRQLGSLSRFAMLNDLGRVALDQGAPERAAALFGEGLKLNWEPGNELESIHSLVGLAGVAGALRQPARAAQLLGAAEAIRASIGGSLTLVERAVFGRYVTATRAQLDDAAFAAAWAEGQQMTLEQATAEALEPLRC